ncbi:flagellar biosynthetic protein FliR, partial [Streptomyces roseoverticillatus]|uniref:flagellar biosynthetic protein FliR n=1 Tax=Streptomyces roseoverticillatus TaxID=66429 RepID=UPI001F227099
VLLRAGLAGALALLLTPVLAPALPPAPATFPLLARMIAAEISCGALLGWLARAAALALPGAGQVISLMTGLSSVLQP